MSASPCPRCLPGAFYCPEAVRLYLACQRARTEPEWRAAWEAYRRHLEGARR